MLPCTSRNNIQAPVLAGAARGALQSRVPARVFSPRPPYGFAAAKASVEAAKGAGGGGNVGVGVGGGPGGCCGGGGLDGGELGGGGGGEGDGGEGGVGWRWGQLQEARVGLERGAELDEWPVMLVVGLERSSKPSAPARNPFCRLRGLPPEGSTSSV